MSYLGQVELKSSEIRRIDVTGSTSATHTLTWTPASEQSLIITINGIKQQNNYSISGTTLTLDDALLSDDKMEVIGILDIGEAVVPPDDSISTAKIQDDAVTADKLADSINTEITANTAKVTNATHTGDVTGATALTIAADAVDIAMLSATGTADSTTFLRGDNAWAAPAGGDNTPSFQARNTSNQTDLASDTFYKIEYDTEDWDTDSAYDNATNYRFTVPAGEGGKYYFHANVDAYTDSGSGYVIQSKMVLYVNGAASNYYCLWDWRDSSGNGINRGNFFVDAVISLSATDYVEAYLSLATDSSVVWKTGDMLGWFTGYKLIGV